MTNNHSDGEATAATKTQQNAKVDHDVCTRYQSATVDHAPTAAFAAAARSCLRPRDKMIKALAFQRVAINNCHARVVEERPSDAAGGQGSTADPGSGASLAQQPEEEGAEAEDGQTMRQACGAAHHHVHL
eukprot:CAMPEP_0204006346 /NCGR_PEP_ID=MMETSP0360-20130528/19724_1 /ASSEMBLY_ACC=CAM_ASM_000342 /TAXON_ID=268821 /ORGANISM="Scrippsiella Hangoei, Strain SHTV-5" /LENGTH=129 /DNA_ID=CAMNT_0050948437 /DNA_START=180 /DNA_END=565 /DNA_ORIENTATION=-